MAKKEKSFFNEGFDTVNEFFKRTSKAPTHISKEQREVNSEVLTTFECAMTDMRDMVSQNPQVVNQNSVQLNGILNKLYDLVREVENIKANG